MPAVFPFHAIQYNNGAGDLSEFVAPPYDVLGLEQKNALLANNEANAVGFDLPHVPAKKLGPPKAYENAATDFNRFIQQGTLNRRETPAMFAYRQTFEFNGETLERCGMACTVETVAFGPRDGGGILPHEQTFSGPKEDRLALMKASATQFSPMFSLHPDTEGRASALVRKIMERGPAHATADLGDGVKHEIWTVDSDDDIAAYKDALAGEDVFIADGHHRYNTALMYLKHLEDTQGPVPADHPARRTMMVLVGMSDPGLAIGPTHRVLGGMKDYSIEKFEQVAAAYLQIDPCENDPHKIEDEMDKAVANSDRNVFGIMDVATGLCFTAQPSDADPLALDFEDKPEAWRKLDVAIIQHLIVDQICKPDLNEGEEITWAFPHSVEEVLDIAHGRETGAGGGSGFAQLAVFVRPTPLNAVRDISLANEVMPQKSTFFYPKVATGLFFNPLAD
ncbi:MAG: DUF1015 domain-containing protein [Planctomycetota bacterium]